MTRNKAPISRRGWSCEMLLSQSVYENKVGITQLHTGRHVPENMGSSGQSRRRSWSICDDLGVPRYSCPRGPADGKDVPQRQDTRPVIQPSHHRAGSPFRVHVSILSQAKACRAAPKDNSELRAS
nr:hypothetical protein CFP56_37324 [Quercus suber]